MIPIFKALRQLLTAGELTQVQADSMTVDGSEFEKYNGTL